MVVRMLFAEYFIVSLLAKLPSTGRHSFFVSSFHLSLLGGWYLDALAFLLMSSSEITLFVFNRLIFDTPS